MKIHPNIFENFNLVNGDKNCDKQAVYTMKYKFRQN